MCFGRVNDKIKVVDSIKTLKDKISLANIISATDAEKTLGKCHIEYQTLENGICGRSLEEAVMNVNRNHYGLVEPVAEEDLEFTEKSKTDFALNLICNNPNYSIPQYIKNGRSCP